MAVKTTITTTPSRRRSLLAAAGAVVIGSGINAGVAAGVLEVAEAVNPDAELIALCNRHRAAYRDFDLHGGHLEPEDCPRWRTYTEALDALIETRPTTAEGWLAKARSVQVERADAGCEQSLAERFAWSLIEDIESGRVRLAGRA